MHYGPFLPKAPSSLQPNVYALPSEVNTTECNPPQAILYILFLKSGLI